MSILKRTVFCRLKNIINNGSTDRLRNASLDNTYIQK